MGPAPALIARWRTHPQVSVLLNEMSPAAQIERCAASHRPQHLAHAGRRRGAAIAALWPDPVAVALPAGIAWRAASGWRWPTWRRRALDSFLQAAAQGGPR